MGYGGSCADGSGYSRPKYIGNYKPGEIVEIYGDAGIDDSFSSECPLNNIHNFLERKYDRESNKFYFKFIMPAYNSIIAYSVISN